MTKKLEILKRSLEKKERLFDEKLANHIATVKQSNGQPLNDKRNGRATLNKWDKQNDALRNLKESIEKTKRAIEIEEGKISNVESAKETLPTEILTLIETGELIQWRKHPQIFFVKGVDKARIVWDKKTKKVAHRFYKEISEKDQRALFAKIYNKLHSSLNCH